MPNGHTPDFGAFLPPPERIAELNPEQLGALLCELKALEGVVMAKLNLAALYSGQGRSADSALQVDDWTTAEELSAKIPVLRMRWLYRHASTLPFARRLSPKKLLFSPSRARQWLNNGKAGKAARG